MAGGEVRTRKPGTNAFGKWTFSADGTATQGCGGYKKRPGSQKRTFQKVDARDLAGEWRGCSLLGCVYCTTKKALNEDQYEESGLACCLGLPCPVSGTRTRKYANGHPTNAFALENTNRHVHWHRDPGGAGNGKDFFFAKKAG